MSSSRRKLAGSRFILKAGDEGYPKAFERLKNPPKALYGIGRIDALQEGLAVVGARKATPYGISCAERFAGLAAERGIAIISGGARGCDSASHKAALEKGCPTVAFLGGGCDEVYPPENFYLFQEIIDSGGAVLSERDFGFMPLPYTFRERNRLIASLAKATLIVEAGLPSGTFSTADEALAANRDVLVVPGSITSKQSRGANRLIYQGATPIVDDETFSDVLFRIYGMLKIEDVRKKDADEMSQGCKRIYDALAAEPLGLDELCYVTQDVKVDGDRLRWVSVQLATLEATGVIARYPDGRYGPCVKRG